MEGRLLGIKKSIILTFTAIFMLFSFITLSVLSFTTFKKPELWFYSFCLCVGLYEETKSLTLKIDSSCFIGTLLLWIGTVGFLTSYLPIKEFLPLLMTFSVAAASLTTFVFYKQKYHIIFAFMIMFVSFYWFLLIKKLISLNIFIAFVTSFLLLFIVMIFTNIKWRS